MKKKTKKKPKAMTKGQKVKRALANMAAAGVAGLLYGFSQSERYSLTSVAYKYRGEKLLAAKKKPMRKAA